MENQFDVNSSFSDPPLPAEPLGLVVTRPGDTLKTLRAHIERFTKGDELHKSQLCHDWRYLDGGALMCVWGHSVSGCLPYTVAFSGRVDRVFQVLPEQEENIIVGDMLSDGILVVEFAAPLDDDEEESTCVHLPMC